MPDSRGGYGSDKRSRIIQLCEHYWPLHANAGNCSGFVKAVAAALGSTGKKYKKITRAWSDERLRRCVFAYIDVA